MKSCLSPERIRALVAGRAPSETERDHVEGCVTCRLRIEARRSRPGDPAETRRAEKERAPVEAPLLDDVGEGLLGRLEDYEVVEEIHRGGQGVVFKAVQTSTHRVVALKVLREGRLATPEQAYRFQREVDLVASLQHPNVVTVFDSGVAGGRPWYAMQYVRGLELDDHVAAYKMSVREIAQLFRKVCAGVGHAHHRGVIHRDLKPSNVVVDAEGEPHVLDFGIARDVRPGSTGGAPMTQTGEFVGTLSHASPEQVSGDPSRVDVRTDVYSLGVMLFRSLTGAPPYPVEGQVADVVRSITEATPRRPSSLRAEVDDEIETIVLKALSKDPSRRYESAGALGDDLERYVRGETIDAKRDSAWYVVRKTIALHRIPFAALGVAAVLLVAFAATVTVMAVRLAKERTRAEQEAAAARQVSGFLVEMFENADPSHALGESVTAREVLEAGARRIELELEGQPLAQARLMKVMGTVHKSLGLHAPARTLLQGALERFEVHAGRESAEVAAVLGELGTVVKAQGDTEKAIDYFQRALALRQKLHGPTHPEVAPALGSLAGAWHDLGKLDEAEKLLRSALAIQDREGGDREDLSITINDLATLHAERAEWDEAERLFDRALSIQRESLGVKHPLIANTLNNMAMAMMQANRDPARAESLQREALAIWQDVLPADHPQVAIAQNNLADILRTQDRHAEALPLYESALAILERRFGPGHWHAAGVLNNFALSLSGTGKQAEAIPHFEKAIAAMESALGAENLQVASLVNNLAEAKADVGLHDEADALFRRALRTWEAGLGPDHPLIAIGLLGRGQLDRARARPADAEASFERAVAIREKAFGADHHVTLVAVDLAATAQFEQGRFADAESAWRRVAAGREKAGLPMARTWTSLANAVERQGRADEAAELRARAAAEEARRPAPPAPSK